MTAQFLIIGLLILAFCRLQLTSSMYRRGLEATSRESRRIVMNTDYADTGYDNNEFMVPYHAYETHSFSLDIFNMTKWTYTQYFPDISESKDDGS